MFLWQFGKFYHWYVLEKTLESPLDWRKIQPVHLKGNQSWIFFGRTDAEAETPILWPLDVKNWLIGKDPDAGQDWGQEEWSLTEDEMVGWHHQLNRHEFVQAPGLVMDSEAWHAAVHGAAKSQTWLRTHKHMCNSYICEIIMFIFILLMRKLWVGEVN